MYLLIKIILVVFTYENHLRWFNYIFSMYYKIMVILGGTIIINDYSQNLYRWY